MISIFSHIKMNQPDSSAPIKRDNGYFEIRLSRWKRFVNYVYEGMLGDEYVWRGQRCEDWKLVTTLDRLIQNGILSEREYYDFRNKHLDKFKFAARGRRGANPPQIDCENDWWALGQHHGLATPLLDWTQSPFVAAFFAFIETGTPQTEHRAIFALHQSSIECLSQEKCKGENTRRRAAREEYKKENKPIGLLNLINNDAEPELIFIKPLSDENQRLITQNGLFTRSMTNKSIETWVSENTSEEEGMTLIKFLIPDTEREECLRTLNRMNINPLSLFPDLLGASKYCNLFSEIKNF